MIIIAWVLEIVWTVLFFFIYLYLLYVAANGENKVTDKTKNIMNIFLGVFSLGIVAVVIALTVLLAKVPVTVVGLTCEEPGVFHVLPQSSMALGCGLDLSIWMCSN